MAFLTIDCMTGPQRRDGLARLSPHARSRTSVPLTHSSPYIRPCPLARLSPIRPNASASAPPEVFIHTRFVQVHASFSPIRLLTFIPTRSSPHISSGTPIHLHVIRNPGAFILVRCSSQHTILCASSPQVSILVYSALLWYPLHPYAFVPVGRHPYIYISKL